MYNQALSVLPRACVLGDGVVVERLLFFTCSKFDYAKNYRHKLVRIEVYNFLFLLFGPPFLEEYT